MKTELQKKGICFKLLRKRMSKVQGSDLRQIGNILEYKCWKAGIIARAFLRTLRRRRGAYCDSSAAEKSVRYSQGSSNGPMGRGGEGGSFWVVAQTHFGDAHRLVLIEA